MSSAGRRNTSAKLNLRAIPDDTLLDLDNQLCFALDVAARMVVRAYRPALAKLGLTHSQYLVLLVLWEWQRKREPKPTVKALGERLALDSGTLTPLLKRMVERDLITRTRSTDDEREVFVRLTPEGAALKKRASCVPRSLLERSPIPLGEIIKLREQLKRLRAAMVDA
jgi:DNA-binding MarR family transcriptional regulator